MRFKTVIVVAVVAAVLLSAIVAMHGRGAHRLLHRWFPTLHGR